MAELKVRQVDDHLVAVLKQRARRKGISLEEEVRRTLAASVAADLEAFAREAAAVRAAGRDRPGDPKLDSARIIREERDAWG